MSNGDSVALIGSETDALSKLFATMDKNTGIVEGIGEALEQHIALERRLSPTKSSVGDADKYSILIAQMNELDNTLKATPITLPSMEGVTDPVSIAYVHGLALESLKVRIRSIMMSLGRLYQRIEVWVGKVLDRINEAIEGTYGRAKRNLKVLTERQRELHPSDITNTKFMILYQNGDRVLSEKEMVNLPIALGNLLEASIADCTDIVKGMDRLYLEDVLSRNNALAQASRYANTRKVASNVTDHTDYSVFNFDIGIRRKRIVISRSNVIQENYNPKYFDTRVNDIDATKEVKGVKTISASAAMDVCKGVMDLITQVRNARKDYRVFSDSSKRIADAEKALKRKGDPLPEVEQRRRDLVGVSKILLGEMGSLYKFIYLCTRYLIDMTDLLLINPKRLVRG